MCMSDMRFIMIGLVAITIGFIVLGVFGAQFTETVSYTHLTLPTTPYV